MNIPGAYRLAAFSLLAAVLLVPMPAAACDPIIFEQFSLREIHIRYGTMLQNVEQTLGELARACETKNPEKIDKSMVRLFLDWREVYLKYDHWIRDNVSGRENTDISRKAREWMQDMKAVGDGVIELNWLLVDDEMGSFRDRLIDITDRFGDILRRYRAGLASGGRTFPAGDSRKAD